VFDAKTSARIEGGSASPDALKSRQELQRGSTENGESYVESTSRPTGVDSKANIEGGIRVQASGTLELFAELFVAFAGFTGLAGVLTRSQAEVSGFSQDLRILVEYSLIYLVLAVVPLVLWHSGFSEHAAWRIACAVSASESIAYYALRFASLRAWSSTTGNIGRLWITAIVEWSMVIALFLAALQIAPIPPSNLYIFHLLLGLVGTVISFGRLVRPILEATRGDAV